jgi:hypothetical protein
VSRAEHLSLLGLRMPAWAQLRVVSIEPGCRRPYDPTEWQGALVVVERGAIELECPSGARWRFQAGAVISLADLPIRALCNERPETALLSALTRRPTPTLTHDASGAEPCEPLGSPRGGGRRAR